MTDIWTDPVVLQGQKIILEPLQLKHAAGLEKNLLTPNAWHCVHWGTRTPEQIQANIVKAQEAREKKMGQGFAMVLKETEEPVGISHFMNLNRAHYYLEIGGTWIAAKAQKTSVNTEAKLLMLEYAFEKIGCQRVEFRVDSLNFNSQRAVLRIGAKFEGELRQSMRIPDGRKRDYKVFSIIDSEWSNIKPQLNWYMEKYV